MFVTFFHDLKQTGVPVSLREYLTLLEAMDSDVIRQDVEDFYYSSRSVLVKDERNLDKFDRVFAKTFKGLDSLSETETAEIPEEWLRALTEKYLTEEEKAQIESLGGWEKLWKSCKSGSKNKKSVMRAAINGLAPAAPRRLAPMAITQRACALARKWPPWPRRKSVGQARL